MQSFRESFGKELTHQGILLKNGINMGRVRVRGVQLLVPETADFNTVQILCDLVTASLYDTPILAQRNHVTKIPLPV
jgi:hypothetical protein